MLNLTHTNSQTSLRGGVSQRSNPFLITSLDCFVATKVAPRNDARAKKFIEENPGTALALAVAPYVGMGAGLWVKLDLVLLPVYCLL